MRVSKIKYRLFNYKRKTSCKKRKSFTLLKIFRILGNNFLTTGLGKVRDGLGMATNFCSQGDNVEPRGVPERQKKEAIR